MLTYPQIDPVAFSIAAIEVHWYGLMYLLGFISAWWLGNVRAERYGFSKQEVSDLIFYGALGVIIGGRFGYVLFYDFSGFIADPLTLFKLWQGGMSFHGGLIGVILALWFFSYRFQKPLLKVTDFIAPMVPIGLGAGRIGNFINAELWGRTTDVAWGMVFPNAGSLPRHPSQLYEFALEGVLLFIILWIYSAKPRAAGLISAWFLIFYGLFRFIVELFREPDAHLGFLVANWMTMGQLLSIPMVILGIYLIWRAKKISDG